MDLVFPNNNEEELLLEAKKLGVQELVFCYNKPPEKKQGTTAILIQDKKDIPKLRKKADLLIANPTREFFEDKRIDAIIGFGLAERKDHTHFKRTITQVDAKLLKEKMLLYSLNDLHKSNKQEELLGRWAQDKRVLKKDAPNAIIQVVSATSEPLMMRSDKDRQALWHSL